MNNWYYFFKSASPPNLDAEGFPENIKPDRNKHTIEYFDRAIDDDLKEKLDKERTRKYLGHGAYGIVYEVKDIEEYNPTGKVVEKLTHETAEFENAEYILKNQIDAKDYPIVKLFAAQQLETKESHYAYRIFMEYVTPVDSKFACAYNLLDIVSMNPGEILNERLMLDLAYRAISDVRIDYMPKDQEAERQIMKNTKKSEIMSYFKDVLWRMRDLEERVLKYKFSPEDVHGANLGWKNGTIYILDVGAVSVQ